MAYSVELTAEVDRELGKLDPQHSKRILKFLYERVAKLDDPRSIGQALRRFVIKKESKFRDYVISGGGAKNQTLVKMIAEEVIPLGLRLRRMEEFDVSSEAKEAVAFAILAYQTWKKRAANLPSATGASHPAVH